MQKLKVQSSRLDSFRSYIKSRNHFRLWRSFDLLSAFFSLVGIMFATLEYELNYSSDRTYENCRTNPIDSYDLRYFVVFSTFAAIGFLVPRYIEKLRWKKRIYFLPRDYDFIAGRKKNFILMGLEILVLCIFPYPHVDRNIYIPLRLHLQTLHTCYTLSEILYCLMFLRFFIILRALINLSKFQDDRGRAYCQSNQVKPNIRYLIKCLVAHDPIFFISGIAILSLFILSLTFRIFERPADELSHFFYGNPMTAIWFMLENMTTLGYGDLYPITYPGRIITVLGYCVGAVIFSLMIISLQRNVQLNTNQAKVHKSIIKIPYSALLIKYCIKHYATKKKFGPNHNLSTITYLNLKSKIKEYRILKATNEEPVSRDILTLKRTVSEVKDQVKEIDQALTLAIENLTKSENTE